MTATWNAVWARAVIVPAWRRAMAAWVGCAIVAAVVFGPNGMQVRDLTELMLDNRPIGAVLSATWGLVFVPTARLLLRADGAAYLRSLPGPALAPLAMTAFALVALQLPWLALWVIGDGLHGLAVVGALTVVIVLLGAWHPPRLRPGWPRWRSSGRALRSIHLRALRRRAGDALVRGAGLAALAGGAAGLFVRNNQLVDAGAAQIGAAVIAAALVPAYAGTLISVLESHRATAWLAGSLAIGRGTRALAVVVAIAAIQLLATAIAIAAAALVAEADLSTIGWLAALSSVIAIGTAIGCARGVIANERSESAPARVVVGAVATAAGAVLALGLLGLAGAVAFLATTLFVLLGAIERAGRRDG